MLPSECSSGCESGWTLYFENSMNPSHPEPAFFDNGDNNDKGRTYQEVGEEPEEDLSMVSDASSGPPHFHEKEDHHRRGCFSFNNGSDGGLNNPYPETEDSVFVQCSAKKSKKTTEPRHQQKLKSQKESSSQYLDDTASSPVMDSLPNNGYIPTNNTASMENFLQYPSHGLFERDFGGNSAIQHQLGYGITQPPTPSPHQWFGWSNMEFN